MDDSDRQLDVGHGWRTLEEVGLAACLLDRRLRYRRVNTAWKAQLRGDTLRFGRQPGAWRNREILADIPEDRRERWSHALQAIVGGRLGHFLDRIDEAHAPGDRTVVTIASPTIDAEGKVDGVLCVRYDAPASRAAVAS